MSSQLATPSVQYLGLAGYGNVGDDAIRGAFTERLGATFAFADVPVGRRAIATRGTRHFLTSRGSALLLGGGTILGRTIWRHHLNRTRFLYRPPTWDMLGAGVEDPDFVGNGSYSSWAEIGRWATILNRFSSVTVRGPRSHAILRRAGIDAHVVGDPALLLGGRRTPVALSERDIDLLVNVTCGEDQWGGTEHDWTPAVAEAVKTSVERGRRVAFVSMDPIDDAWNERVARRIGLVPELFRPRDHDDFFGVAERSKLVVGTRLHANVLAAAAGTPTISLEYRPKCRDFMESIDMASSCHRVDRLKTDDLRLNIEAILADWSTHHSRTSSSVSGLRTRLTTELSSIADRLAG
jgi:exopolysaccharide biosynthesis predicted pyruvyltransferase EpsI